ncbi:MAG TPA: hypothetical protein IAC82_01995 [Candidatus Merdivicinus intestinigallinarum]|nr:hypothetical protein [Candidatus Merdivicinus intestinigallinarum]
MDFVNKIQARGHPRAVCGPPFFFLFAAGPRKAGFRFLRETTKGFAFGNHKLLKSLTKTFYFLLLCSFAFKKVFSTSWACSALWRSGLFPAKKYFSTFLPKGPAGTP